MTVHVPPENDGSRISTADGRYGMCADRSASRRRAPDGRHGAYWDEARDPSLSRGSGQASAALLAGDRDCWPPCVGRVEHQLVEQPLEHGVQAARRCSPCARSPAPRCARSPPIASSANAARHALGGEQGGVLPDERRLRLGEDAQRSRPADSALELDADREAALELRDQVGRLDTWNAPGRRTGWSVRHQAVLGVDGRPSTIGGRSRCTPSRETSGPPVRASVPAILSISSRKTMPDSRRGASLATTFSISTRRAASSCVSRTPRAPSSSACASLLRQEGESSPHVEPTSSAPSAGHRPRCCWGCRRRRSRPRARPSSPSRGSRATSRVPLRRSSLDGGAVADRARVRGNGSSSRSSAASRAFTVTARAPPA